MYSGNRVFTVLYEVCDQNLGFSLRFLPLKEKKFVYDFTVLSVYVCRSVDPFSTFKAADQFLLHCCCCCN